MKKFLVVVVSCAAFLLAGVAQAGPQAQRLGVCLTESLNGKERKQLAKWVFLSISAHSTIKPYSSASPADIDDSNRYVGGLITRLLTDDCPSQARAAFEENGARAFEDAFRVVGEVAMMELMNEPAVGESMGAFEKYLDQEKFNQAFQ
ncbi:hypothetical protein Y5S_02076 [Alcanivorax nanhaiticus]|uniref:Uncharacterized protein n=1 Tax=Alcanivorax nanhaiticus TaxID=1177154 RepID=A0A095UQ97_9GAMM|nr:hypothetical protein [Alcanivorax nanhaiticus]KGD64710.1 hypothetical protein Y5S_02076 [Alcanivorax nanhaiticus]